MECFVGVDVGTSGAKALVVDAEGRVLGRGHAEYPLATPQAGWAEQDPDDWVRGAAQATAAAVKEAREAVGPQGGQKGGAPLQFRAMGLSGQMHSTVFLDSADRVLRPAILWCDQRTVAACATLNARIGGQQAMVAVALNKAFPGFTAPKVVWLKAAEPQHYARVRRLLIAKDYLRFRWTGEAATEVSDASGSLLLDIEARDWSPRLCEAAGVDAAWLPRVFESHEVTGGLRPSIAAELGLPVGLPVVGGGGDQAAGALGCGLAKPGGVTISLGTSGVVFGVCARPLVDSQGRLHSFAHAVPGRWHAMGVVLSAGGALRWYRDSLGSGGPSFSTLDAEAAAVPAGARDLCFLPYLSGERTPIDDPAARAAFVGLDLRHGRGEMARAVLEGVSFALADCLSLATECGLQTQHIRVTGGGARSRVWLQILASALDLPLHRLAQDEGPAFGAAMLAASADSREPVLDLVRLTESWVSEADEIQPEPAAAARYRESRPHFRQTYAALRTLRDA